jgi:hypothetical protein
MIRSLLASTKTQTRRIVKPQPIDGMEGIFKRFPHQSGSPYGEPGHLLWVRETWAHYHTVNHIRRPDGRAFSEVSDGLAGYRADGHDTIEDFRDHVRLISGPDLEAVEIRDDRWRPSIHMPRWASRLTLELADVRVERLQAISEQDAEAEGCPVCETCLDRNGQWGRGAIDDPLSNACGGRPWHTCHGICEGKTAKEWYASLWDSINGPSSWAENPFVWALSFRVLHQNVDQVLAARRAA